LIIYRQLASAINPCTLQQVYLIRQIQSSLPDDSFLEFLINLQTIDNQSLVLS